MPWAHLCDGGGNAFHDLHYKRIEAQVEGDAGRGLERHLGLGHGLEEHLLDALAEEGGRRGAAAAEFSFRERLRKGLRKGQRLCGGAGGAVDPEVSGPICSTAGRPLWMPRRGLLRRCTVRPAVRGAERDTEPGLLAVEGGGGRTRAASTQAQERCRAGSATG